MTAPSPLTEVDILVQRLMAAGPDGVQDKAVAVLIGMNVEPVKAAALVGESMARLGYTTAPQPVRPDPGHKSGRGAPGGWQWFCFWYPQGSMDLERTLAEMPATDTEAAWLIKEQYGNRLHYLTGLETAWHLWDEKCHRPDTSAEVARLVTSWAVSYKAALAQCVTADRSAYLTTHDGEQGAESKADAHVKRWEPKHKYATSVLGNPGHERLSAMLAKTLAAEPGALDERHPEWLNFGDCTVDLRTRTPHPHNVDDLLTYALPWAYDSQPGAWRRCPKFLKLAWSVAGGNQEVFEFLLKVLGYALLGDNREQVIIFINGPTKSGKSQLLYVVRELLRELGYESKADLICVTRHGRNARVENSIRGKRLVTIAETSEFMHIEEGQLKRLTGEPVVSVDEHYAKRALRTPVTWLIIVATNNMPSITSFDGAMQERVLVIPGGPTIPLHLRDKGLAEAILREEASAVLALLVQACGQYFAEGGLVPPPAVAAETVKYRSEQNTVANFLADAALRETGAEVGMAELWEGYERWARGAVHIMRNGFHEQMTAQPGISKFDNGGSRRVYIGIRWNDSWRNRIWVA